MEQRYPVQNLTEAVAYQDDAIVSKTVMNKETGSVTLFAFDKGQELSEHTSPFDALVTILDGVAEIRISGHPVRVQAGEMVIMPANEPHALAAVARFKMLLVMIRS